MKFFSKLSVLMTRKGITQAELAAELGITQASVSGWKSGSKPRKPLLKKLSDYFQVDPTVLEDDDIDLPTQTDNREVRLEEFLTRESPLKNAEFKDEQDVIHAIRFLGHWLCVPEYRKELFSVTRKILDRYFAKAKQTEGGFDKLKVTLRAFIKNASDDTAMTDTSKILEELMSENPTVDGLLFRLWKIPPRK